MVQGKKLMNKKYNEKINNSIKKKVIEHEEEEEEEEEEEDDDDDYDDEQEIEIEGDEEGEDEDNNDEEEEEDNEDDDDDDFEQQSSSDEELDVNDDSDIEEGDEETEAMLREAEMQAHRYSVGASRHKEIEEAKVRGEYKIPQLIHTDDLSSDDEEDVGANTIGRVPLHWYDAYDHIGYNVAGQKVIKRKVGDKIDAAIAGDSDAAGRTIYDMYNDREIVLSDRDIEIIRRMQAGAFAHPEFNDTPDYIDYISSQKEIMPISSAPEAKRGFVPSKWEMMKVMKIVKAMKEGRYTPLKDRKNDKENKPSTYMIWNDLEDEVLAESKRNKYHLPAPKMPLPGHAESYNPPPEYLLSDKEKKEFDAMDPSDRPYNFIPKKHDCLRHVSGYDNFVKERFERCLDLYLCPRKLKKRLNIDPDALIPRLPKPRELRPYPNSLCLQYLGHKKSIRALSLSPDGQYMVSCSDDCTVRLWEVDTCLCRYIWQFEGPVLSVAWNPNPSHHLIAAIVGKKVVLIATGTGDIDSTEITEALLSKIVELADTNKGKDINDDDDNEDNEDNDDDNDNVNDDDDDKEENTKKASKRTIVKWYHHKNAIATKKRAAQEIKTKFNAVIGPRIEMKFREDVTYICWHYKGDYLGVMAPSAGTQSVSIHQLSKAKSQCPFTKNPGNVQAISFHPSRPFFFVVTQQHIKLFNLTESTLVKRLISGCKWLSSIDIHPNGDHIIVGSYDRRVVWFDLDLSSAPYKTLKFHEKAVRSVQYHKRYPLFASSSDDGTVHIFHSTVYTDLTRDPMIVPLKVLRGHGVVGGLGVTVTLFHPKQPWILTGGADCVINLFQDI